MAECDPGGFGELANGRWSRAGCQTVGDIYANIRKMKMNHCFPSARESDHVDIKIREKNIRGRPCQR